MKYDKRWPCVVKKIDIFVNKLTCFMPNLKQDCPVKLKNAGHTGPQARHRTVYDLTTRKTILQQICSIIHLFN